tara:strand:- start:190 stop:3714 length:3525 start_codon:yes stop_codon:yes gene_type:complete
MSLNFNHLHVHSEFSLLDGMSKIPDLVNQAATFNMSSLALTDHGNLYGAVEFYQACKKTGIKPIIGCELYLAKNNLTDKNPSERSPYHLTALAINGTGYKNLVTLVTTANLKGFYYKPRIDYLTLAKYSEGLVILSGCPASDISKFILENNQKEIKTKLSWYKKTFGERYFLEIQRHKNVDGLEKINNSLIDLGSEFNIPIVATNDSHYTLESQHSYHDALLCVQTNAKLSDEKRFKFDDTSYYLKSSQEMLEIFNDMPQTLENTNIIADMVDESFTFPENKMPIFKCENNIPPFEFLKQKCIEGFDSKFPNGDANAKNRMNYELEIIKQTDFSNYFLVVWDLIEYTRNRKILFGIRGSAAASIVLYVLNVTQLNPLLHNLVFERFLNIERKEMPDIDIDFQDDRREEVMNYVVQKYGSQNVAQIITFGTLGAKAAIRDAGRVMGINYDTVDSIAKEIPVKPGITLKQALEESPILQSKIQTDNTIRSLIQTAQGIEGVIRHASTHAAGVVVSEEPLTNSVPLQFPVGQIGTKSLMTQYSMDPIASLGLLKLDFLGLTNLTILDKTIKSIKADTGETISLNSLELNDKKTFNLLSSGDTSHCFQLESEGMQKYIQELKPSSLEDISAMIALYRPGPMDQIEQFIGAKHGKIASKSIHPDLDAILEDTYGIIVYQDQVLLLLQKIAGYSLGEADIVRKAMGKKIPELMQKEKQRFLSGATKNNFSEEFSNNIFSLIEPFAGYAFNKAHSFSYALIAYWTTFFKANYPIHYMMSVLNSRIGHPDKIADVISECKRLRIKVKPPNINLSTEEFSIHKNGTKQSEIIYGFSAIKHLGNNVSKAIVECRQKTGQFNNMEDCLKTISVCNLNRRALENLIKSGAFDELGDRNVLIEKVGSLIDILQREAKILSSGQVPMFESNPSLENNFTEKTNTPSEKQLSIKQYREWEEETLGINLTLNNSPIIDSIDRIGPELIGKQIKIDGVLVSSRKGISQKTGTPYMNGIFKLIGGEISVSSFGKKHYDEFYNLWISGNQISLEGELKPPRNSNRFDFTFTSAIETKESISQEIKPLEKTPEPIKTNEDTSSQVIVDFTISNNETTNTTNLKQILECAKQFSGTSSLRIYFLDSEEKNEDDINISPRKKKNEVEFRNIRVKYCDELKLELDKIDSVVKIYNKV